MQRNEPEKVIRILVVDDHLGFRKALGSILTGIPDMVTVGEAGNGKEAVEKARELKPDIVIMDLRMPEMNGVKATAVLNETMPQVNILVLTLFDEADDLYSAMKAGAKGYLLKSAELDGLIAAIRQIASGDVIFTSILASRLMADFHVGSNRKSQKETAGASSLTAQEKQVLQYIAQELNSQETARQLGITENVVKTIQKEILEKFQAKHKSEMDKLE